jgi:Flp pilus assembly CpaE family ATPase
MLTAKAQTASQIEGFRAGAIDYITKPVHPQDLVARIVAVLERARAAQADTGSSLIVVTGAKGGVGATTLAANLALALAQQQRTLLIDLETNGSLAIHLGVDPLQGLTDLAQQESGPNDSAALDDAITVHPSGLKFIAATDLFIEPARIGLILNQAANLCEACVVDLGWGVSDVARLVAQRCKAFIIALDSDRVTLSQANRLLQVLKEAYVPPEAIKLVWINRQGLPAEPGQLAIASVVGRPPDLVLGSAADVLYQALDKGQPLVLYQPDHPMAVQLREFAQGLLPSR